RVTESQSHRVTESQSHRAVASARGAKTSRFDGGRAAPRANEALTLPLASRPRNPVRALDCLVVAEFARCGCLHLSPPWFSWPAARPACRGRRRAETTKQIGSGS